MFFISPEKLLVILGVAMLVVGPDKLPKLAGQIGAYWRELQRWRTRLESEAKEVFPDLPPMEMIGQAIRSPLSYLDGLAAAGNRDEVEEGSASAETRPAPVLRATSSGTVRGLQGDSRSSPSADPSMN